MKGKQSKQEHDGHQQHSGPDGSTLRVPKKLDPAEKTNLHQEEEDAQYSREGPGGLNVPGDLQFNLDMILGHTK